MTSPSVLVLGLGNDLLTDDAVGLHVVRAVRAALADVPAISVRETMEMGLALLDEIAGFEALLLVDSVQTGRAPPGYVHELAFDALVGRRNAGPHFVGIGETLALGRLVGLAMPERGRIVAIEVEDPFTLGTRLTPDVAAAVPRAVEQVVELARELTGSPASTAVIGA